MASNRSWGSGSARWLRRARAGPVAAGVVCIAGLASPGVAGIVNGGFEGRDGMGNPTIDPWTNDDEPAVLVDPDDANNHILRFTDHAGFSTRLEQTFDCGDAADARCHVTFRYFTDGSFSGRAELFSPGHSTMVDLTTQADWTTVSLSIDGCSPETTIRVTVDNAFPAFTHIIYVDDFVDSCIPAPGAALPLAGGLVFLSRRRRSA